MTVKRTHTHRGTKPVPGLTTTQATVITLHQLAREASRKAQRALDRYNRAFCTLRDDEVSLVIERTGVKGW